MSLTSFNGRAGRNSATRVLTTGWPAASALLVANLLTVFGGSWDVQWHDEVGPDTFFTAPHLLIYAGSAIAGLTSLAVVLATTVARRAGRPIDPTVGGPPTAIFGRNFTAPVGYVVSGVGAASFLLYGLWDQWWHGLYGFDAVINSPPHVALLLAVTITIVGMVTVFAAARQYRWGKIGVFAGAAMLLVSSSVTVLALEDVESVVNWVDVYTAFLSILLVLMAAAFLETRGGAVAMAVSVSVLQIALWWFAPWATHAYARAVGLPLRDFVLDVPRVPGLVPMCLIPVAAVLEFVLWAALFRNVAPRWVFASVGGFGALLLTAMAPIQYSWLYPVPLPDVGSVLATCAMGLVFGLLAGFLGWRFGGMLRLVARRPEGQ